MLSAFENRKFYITNDQTASKKQMLPLTHAGYASFGLALFSD